MAGPGIQPNLTLKLTLCWVHYVYHRVIYLRGTTYYNAPLEQIFFFWLSGIQLYSSIYFCVELFFECQLNERAVLTSLALQSLGDPMVSFQDPWCSEETVMQPGRPDLRGWVHHRVAVTWGPDIAYNKIWCFLSSPWSPFLLVPFHKLGAPTSHWFCELTPPSNKLFC